MADTTAVRKRTLTSKRSGCIGAYGCVKDFSPRADNVQIRHILSAVAVTNLAENPARSVLLQDTPSVVFFRAGVALDRQPFLFHQCFRLNDKLLKRSRTQIAFAAHAHAHSTGFRLFVAHH